MATKELGTISRVDDLKTIWEHEAHDFTPWLASAESLALLGDAVGMTLDLREMESFVGAFRADIIATDADTGSTVVIENQLEDTNHDHLGKTITYAAGKDAQAVVWVVRHARDEHRKAVEWLNEHTDDQVAFFLVEVEVWRIGDSLPAPHFNVVERPNEWARSVRRSEGYSDTEKLRLAYWTRYCQIADGDREFAAAFKLRKPSGARWTILGCAGKPYHFALIVDVPKGRTGIELYVDDDKETGRRVIKNQTLFERRLSLAGESFDAEEKKASALRLYKQGRDITAGDDKWDSYIKEQIGWALEMRKVVAELGL